MNYTPGEDEDRQREAERALLLGASAGMDASSELYRRIFEILREPMPAGLEPGFRHHVAALAMKSRQGTERAPGQWPAVVLMVGLLAVLVVTLVQKAAQIGWSDAFDLPTQAIVAVAMVALGDLWLRSRRRGRPRRIA